MPGLNLTPSADAAAALSRISSELSTGAVAPGVGVELEVPLSRTYLLFRLTTSAPARVRLYTSPERRSADAARTRAADPEGNHGLVAEMVTTVDDLTYDLSPTVVGLTEDSSGLVPIIVENDGADEATISVTFDYVKME